MGFEDEMEVRQKAFQNYQVNEELVKVAKPDYVFVASFAGATYEEVTDGVIDSENSVVFDQAKNRLQVLEKAGC